MLTVGFCGEILLLENVMWEIPELPDYLDHQFETERAQLTHTAERYASWEHYFESRWTLLDGFNRPGQIEELRRLYDAHH